MRKVTSWGSPRSNGYRVPEAAGVGHPAGQRARGIAVMVLVFAPVSVVFPATALKLEEETGRQGELLSPLRYPLRRPQQRAGKGPPGGHMIYAVGSTQEVVSTHHWRGMQANTGQPLGGISG